MEASERVFVDSNFFIGLFNERDALSEKSINLGAVLESEQLTMMVSDYIFLEVVTILSQRASKDSAKTAGVYLLEDPWVKMVRVSEELQQETWRIFKTVESKNFSFVDASILAVMNSEGVHNLLTFDTKDFKPLQSRFDFSLWNG